MEALASIRSAAAEGMSLMNQRALLDATVDELVGGSSDVGGGAPDLEALRAPLLAALDAEPALPCSIIYLYLLCVFRFWVLARLCGGNRKKKSALRAWERRNESERASSEAAMRSRTMRRRREKKKNRCLSLSPSLPLTFSLEFLNLLNLK